MVVVVWEGTGEGVAAGAGFQVFFDVSMDGWQSALERVERILVGDAPITNRVGHIPAHQIVIRTEFADEIRLVGGFGVKRFHILAVTARHRENMSGLFHVGAGEELAAEAAEIHFFFFQDICGVLAGFFTGGSADPGTLNMILIVIPHQRAEQAFRHGAAADIAGADEDDVFHRRGVRGRVGPDSLGARRPRVGQRTRNAASVKPGSPNYSS